MTLAQFSFAVGSSAKWVQNASALLGLSLRYTVEEARYFALIWRLTDQLEVPLAQASDLAAEALRPGSETEPLYRSPDCTIALLIDRERFLSDFNAALVYALHHYEERRRGRPPQRRGRTATERAREYGIDIGLLDEALKLTPAERLRRLDENLEFIKALRRRRRA